VVAQRDLLKERLRSISGCLRSNASRFGSERRRVAIALGVASFPFVVPENREAGGLHFPIGLN
jgi:hypothetical protein